MAATPAEIISLAKEIHGHFRACCKCSKLGRLSQTPHERAMHNTHDHGWVACRQKAYFLRRAVHTLKMRKRCPF